MDDFDTQYIKNNISLSTIYCDFLPRVLFEQKRINEERKRELDAQNLIKLMQIKNEGEIVAAKMERMQAVFEHGTDVWNPLVLDYIDDINNPENIFKALNTKPKSTEKRDLKVSELIDDNPIRNDYEVKPLDLQVELEKLWSELIMPSDQKMDMAIKYGSHKASNLSEAIFLWQPVCALIIKREELLKSIEKFETKASDST
jgi:hypothetical protein